MRRQQLFRVLARAVATPDSLTTVDLTSEDLAAVVDLANEHRVAGQLRPALVAAGLPIPEEIEALCSTTAVVHLLHVRALERVARTFERAGIPWVVLKGPLLAALWYRDATARRYYDLDVLVDPACFAAAVEALAAEGFDECNYNWTGFRALGMGEVPLTDGQITLDLHWHVLPFEKDRRAFAFRTADILRRRLPVTFETTPAWAPADDDLVSHVTLHAALAGARRLVHLRDIQVVASAVDWAAGVERMRAIGMDRPASAAIDRVEQLLGPLGAGRRAPALGHPGWRALNSTVDAAWRLTTEAKPFPSVLMAAGRESWRATVGETGRQLATAARRRVGLRTLTTEGGPLSWTRHAGGSAERDRYFHDVEAGSYGR